MDSKASENQESEKPQYIESVVCKESEIANNELKVFDFGEYNKVLLIKQKGKMSALGHLCPHHGGPMEEGVLGKGRIRCPWHGACFNIQTGDIEDFPCLDNIPSYEVKCKDGNVWVKADKKHLSHLKVEKPFTPFDSKNRTTFIVVGGGPAGMTCAETLRGAGFSGRLIFVLGEAYLPYDRVTLAKTFDWNIENIGLRNENFYERRGIEIKKGISIREIQPISKTISLSNGERLQYEKLFLGTGARAVVPSIDGVQLENILVLRTVDDAAKIKKAVTLSSNVVILGTSFVGMEISATLVDKVKTITMISKDKVPYEHFGIEVGRQILKIFQAKGVRFYLENGIKSFIGNGKVSKVILKDGAEIGADVCILGTGVTANTDYISAAGVPLLADKTIPVDFYLRTSMEDVYAGGVIATAPILGFKASIGHYGHAQHHGYVAALNMVGNPTPTKSIPFFWTSFFGNTLKYCGYAPKFKSMTVVGNLEEFRFVVFYVVKDKVDAVLTVGWDPVAAQYAELLQEGRHLLPGDVFTWLKSVGKPK